MCFEKNRKIWNLEEQILLKQLYETFGPKSWKKISKQFKKHGFRRKEIQIRQKWINHMDPDISNSDWNPVELQTLYRAFDSVGSKWCLIRKEIPGRTQVKIKNKFYSNIRVYIRFVSLFFEGKNCKHKQLINRIPPNILNQIYNGQKRFQFFRDEFRKVLAKMDFQINKKVLESRIDENLILYKEFNEQLNEVFFEISEHEEFKHVFENDGSYYSEMESDKSKRIKTGTKIGSNLVFRQVSSSEEENVVVKQEEIVEVKRQEISQEIQNNCWTTVITLQPRKDVFQPVYYFSVFYPWQMVKTQ